MVVFLLCPHRNSILSTCCLEVAIVIIFSDILFYYNGIECYGFDAFLCGHNKNMAINHHHHLFAKKANTLNDVHEEQMSQVRQG